MHVHVHITSVNISYTEDHLFIVQGTTVPCDECTDYYYTTMCAKTTQFMSFELETALYGNLGLCTQSHTVWS